MNITRIQATIEPMALSRPYTIAFRTVDAVRNLIIRVETDAGLVGLGAGSPEPYVTGETLESALSAVENLQDELLSCDVRALQATLRALDKLVPKNPAARAALDIAFHDLHAQYLDKPLVDVLGRVHTCLPTSITIGIKSVEETLRESDEYVARGFFHLKVKLGHDLDIDLERLVKLRERHGTRINMRVDANQGYDLQQIRSFFARCTALDLELVEQPIAVVATPSLRELPWEYRKQIAADEALLSERTALDLLRPEPACGIYNIKLMKCGGIRPALGIAVIAQLSGIDLMWGCNDESCISIAAALHAAFASPATRFLDLDGSLDLGRDIASGGFVIEEGVMRLMDRPGLGVRLLP